MPTTTTATTTTPSTSSSTPAPAASPAVQQFFASLKQNPGLKTQLAAVREGDWDSVVNIAQAAGFTFTKEQLMAQMPDGFFKGQGKNPNVGWRKDHQAVDTGLLLSAHTVWASYKGQPVFQQNERAQFKSFLFALADQHGVRVLKGKVDENTVYLNLHYPMHLSLGKFIEEVRAQSSSTLKDKLPDLETQLNKTPLWDPALDVWSDEKDAPHRIQLFKAKFPARAQEQTQGHQLST